MAAYDHHIQLSSPATPTCTIESSPTPLIVVSRETCIHKPADGIHVTWQDLCVTVAAGKRPILRGITGYVRPAEVLAVMGPSGCGKSTLLDAISGRLGSSTKQKGDILINGCKQELAYGTSAYVTQDDTLVATLTVREAVYYSAQLQLPDSMSKSDKKARAEATIREMGLEDCMDTKIGGWQVKGLSGGQKRRVSICIEMLRRPKLVLLDEPTSGLDSATSYHVMKRIINLAQIENMSVIASIHQPSNQVFMLFHNLCLLSSGATLYFGPILAADEYFASNGFICPPMATPSDHYLTIINQDFDDDEEGYGGKGSTVVEAIKVLVKAYNSSHHFRHVKQSVDDICQKDAGLSGKMKKGGEAGFITQCAVLTQRSFVNMFRDVGYYWYRFILYVSVALCAGAVYHDIGFTYNSIQARASVIVYTSTCMTFMAIGGFPSFVEDMKVFLRERQNGHYSVATFVIGNTLSSTPYIMLISLIPGVVCYYLAGLQKSPAHFSYFTMLLFACLMLVESLMMVVAAVVPDFLVGIVLGASIQALTILHNGYFRLHNDIPKFFWRNIIYRISFHNYAIQGFFKNEFLGLTLGEESGDVILKNVMQTEMGHSKWFDLFLIFGMTVVLRILFWGILKSTEKYKTMIRAF